METIPYLEKKGVKVQLQGAGGGLPQSREQWESLRGRLSTAVDTESSSYQGRMSLEALRATAPSTSQISAKDPGQQAVRKPSRVLTETLDFDESANAQLKTCPNFSNRLY